MNDEECRLRGFDLDWGKRSVYLAPQNDRVTWTRNWHDALVFPNQEAAVTHWRNIEDAHRNDGTFARIVNVGALPRRRQEFRIQARDHDAKSVYVQLADGALAWTASWREAAVFETRRRAEALLDKIHDLPLTESLLQGLARAPRVVAKGPFPKKRRVSA